MQGNEERAPACLRQEGNVADDVLMVIREKVLASTWFTS
jgi:hypothetical protein